MKKQENKKYYKESKNKEQNKNFKDEYAKQLDEYREKNFKNFLLSNLEDDTNFEFFLYKCILEETGILDVDMWTKWERNELDDFLFKVPDGYVKQLEEKKRAAIIDFGTKNAECNFELEYTLVGIENFKRDLVTTSTYDTKKEILEKLGLNNKKDLSEEDFETDEFRSLIKG